MVEKRKAAMIAVPCVGAGLGLTFLLYRMKQTIITVATSKAVHYACKPTEDTYTLTVTITDGFGRPRANESFTLRTYINGTKVSEDTFTTDSEGQWSGTLYWYGCRKATEHQDTEARYTATHEVTCRGAVGKASIVVVFWACIDYKYPWTTPEGATVYCCIPST